MRASKWKIAFYLTILFFGVLIALPNMLTPTQLEKLPDWFPKKKVTLGLDLRGGSQIVLEIDTQSLIQKRLDDVSTEARALLRDEKIPIQTIVTSSDSIIISSTDIASAESILHVLKKLNNDSSHAGTGQAGPDLNIKITDSTKVRLSLSETYTTALIKSAVDQSLEIVRRRIDQIGVSEPTIQRVGVDRILVQLPGLQDPSHLRELLGSTAKMTFHLLDVNFHPGTQVQKRGVTMLPDIDGTHMYPVQDKVMLGGENLTDSRTGFNPQTGAPIVSFKFDKVGARQFTRITQENIGKPLAIVMDGKVLSAPVIREAITEGSGQISGHFTVQEATTLSALLRAGALPVPLKVIEERTVGPDLGIDAIDIGVKSGLAGFGLVFVFMLFLYGRWGLIANFALALNVVLTFGALSLLNATLTLPGIAGIVLGIGLAVDANVLINERIREESGKGRKGLAALDAGFHKAYATIVDSNLTALIATILLFYFGTGAVKGFAVTMALGICISMFTAVSVVKIIMESIVIHFNIKDIRVKPLIDFFPHDTKIPFMKARFFGIGTSILLSLLSVVLFMHPGLNYGVDFKGGILIEATFNKPVDLGLLRNSLAHLGLGDVALQEVGTQHSILLRAERQEGGEEAQIQAVGKIKTSLAEYSSDVKFDRTEVIGPKISRELAHAGILSVILASICMLFYIWWRFEWPFAVGAIATLVLDITKTIGFFALTGLEFNLTAIAALLTLVGYSVNDKVVVYDRMRENMRLYKDISLRDIIDKSINETLGRSLYTSVTAFLSMLPMAIWGGSVVSSFAIPMVFGIVIAASSSVFIAAPILLFLGDWRAKRASESAQRIGNFTITLGKEEGKS